MHFHNTKTGIRNNGGILNITSPIYADYVNTVIDAKNHANITVSGPSFDNCTTGIRISNNSSGTINGGSLRTTFGVVSTNHANASVDNMTFRPLAASYAFGVYSSNSAVSVVGSGCTFPGFAGGSGSQTHAAVLSYNSALTYTSLQTYTSPPSGAVGIAGSRIGVAAIPTPERP